MRSPEESTATHSPLHYFPALTPSKLGKHRICMHSKHISNLGRSCFHFLAFVLFLSRILCAQQPSQKPSSLPDAPNPATPKNFFARWAHFYRNDWFPPSATSPAPATSTPPRRGLPSPLDSPPFPNSDWSYGGSPVIGEPDTNTYPLMTAINNATSRSKLYGWLDPSVNFSTSTHTNAPEANDVYSNRLELNQLVLYAERLPNSVQRDHVDWGYHFTALFGTDYRFTTGKGYGSGQWVIDHHQYGFDPTLEYLDIYIPH